MASTSFPENAQDWRGRFIADMAASLARKEEVALTLWAPPGMLPDGVSSAVTPGDARWLKCLSTQGGIAHLLRMRKVSAVYAALQLLIRLARIYRKEDVGVCHINWLQNALPLLGTNKPALITVLGSDLRLLRLPGMTTLLRLMLRNRRAILAPNAEWMRKGLEQAFGDVARILPIPLGVDDAWFAVERRPTFETCHWLAVTRLTRKKIGNLFAWGEGLFGRQRQLHLFGPMQENIVLPDWVHYHGPTYPSELANNWFPQACGLITLSDHDEGRPQVMLEAMAAGLPVIASDLPAHRDIIRHQKNGWLAAATNDFRDGLVYLEDEGRNLDMGMAARAWARDFVGTWDDCAERYVVAYRQLMGPAK